MKTLKTLFGLFILVAVVYMGWAIGPVLLANYQLEDSIDEISRNAAVQQPARTDEQIRQAVMKEVQSLHIPLTSEQINVQRVTGGQLGTDVLIWADYSVHFDIPLYPFDMEFHPASKNKKRAG